MEAVPSTSYAAMTDHRLAYSGSHYGENIEDPVEDPNPNSRQRHKQIIRITYRTCTSDIKKITSKISLFHSVEDSSFDSGSSQDGDDKKARPISSADHLGRLLRSSNSDGQVEQKPKIPILIITTLNFNRNPDNVIPGEIHVEKENIAQNNENESDIEAHDEDKDDSDEEDEEDEDESFILNNDDENSVEDQLSSVSPVSILSHDDVMPIVDVTSEVRVPRRKENIVTAVKKRYHSRRVGGGYKKDKGPGKVFFPHRIFAVSMSRYEDAMTTSRHLLTRQWQSLYDEIKRHLGVPQLVGDAGEATFIPLLDLHIRLGCCVCIEIRKQLSGNTGKNNEYFPVKAADRTTFWKYVHGEGAVSFEDENIS